VIKLDKKIIVIDLDGTFVSVNTFHQWMLFIAQEALKKLALIAFVKILFIIILRAFKRINHAQMKYAILKISETLISVEEIKIFVKSLDKYVHKEILKILNSKEYITILATAAPQIYAKTISRVYNFDYETSTPPSTHKVWKENLKEEKKKNVLALLETEERSLEIERLYTDHHDDLPLMEYAKVTYLVDASESTVRRVKNAEIYFEYL